MSEHEKEIIRERVGGMSSDEIQEMLSVIDIAYIFNELENRCRRYDAMETELRQYTMRYLND